METSSNADAIRAWSEQIIHVGDQGAALWDTRPCFACWARQGALVTGRAPAHPWYSYAVQLPPDCFDQVSASMVLLAGERLCRGSRVFPWAGGQAQTLSTYLNAVIRAKCVRSSKHTWTKR